MKKRILVDMDGVLVDIYPVFFRLHEEETGERLTLSDIIGKLEAEAFKNQRRWVNTPGFFRNLPVMKGCREVLRRLDERYEIIIGSLATEFPDCMTDKQMWIQENFPFISWKQIVFCGDKNLIKADIMIDDHFKNLDNFEGMTILFTQPHNIKVKKTRHTRVASWDEIEKIL
ncbi:MAG: 5'(3')-deoxyribonucleotidase [Bacteroidales bacterium]|jgi:5'(3')-deoxyribonucleotidase|nr:5'(3')-deoxyribonucleotidase [Bacteroidales bacterium]